MILTITDNRYSNERHLHEVELGGFFVWKDAYICRRLDITSEVEAKPVKDDAIPCEFMRTGELIGIGRDTMVEPIVAELVVVD